LLKKRVIKKEAGVLCGGKEAIGKDGLRIYWLKRVEKGEVGGRQMQPSKGRLLVRKYPPTKEGQLALDIG